MNAKLILSVYLIQMSSLFGMAVNYPRFLRALTLAM